MTLLPKNSVESAGSTCFVCGQRPVGKGQLAVQSGTEFLVRPPFPALSNESIGTPRGVSLGPQGGLLLLLLLLLLLFVCVIAIDVVCGFVFLN